MIDIEKNIIKGSITNVNGDVLIGDRIKIDNHYLDEKIPKELTLFIPRLEQTKIIGRELELEDLNKRLFENKQVVLVNGLGGLGKTTLAQVYMTQYWEDYQHIAWINALSNNFKIDLISTSGLCSSLKIDTNGKETEEIFSNIIMKLKSLDGKKPNLMIIDNASKSLDKYYHLLPKQPNWHILATARVYMENFDIKELDFLSEEDSIKLFLLNYKECDVLSKNDIKTIVKLVDYHTLVIEILAKTAKRKQINLEELKKAIENDLESNIAVNHKGNEKIGKIKSYLTSTFKISELNDNEIFTMKQFACLPSEYIPFEVLIEILDTKDNKDKSFYSEILEELYEKGWLLKNKKSYKIHQTIATVIEQQNIKVEDIKELVENIIQKLSIDYTKDNPIDKFEWIPYGKSILKILKSEDDARISILQNNLALVLQYLGDYKEAKTFLQKAMKSNEKNFGEEHPNTAIRYSNLALVLQDLGDYKEAKIFLEKSMKSNEKNFGKEHPSTAISYSNLALVLKDLGDYEEAKTFLEKALKSDEKNFGEEHPRTAIRYSNLALVLKDLGDYEEAKTFLQKALKSNEKNFGEEHPNTAIRYSNLASVLQDLGDYKEAKIFLEKSMKSNEKNFGKEHPSTAISYSNLALVLKDLGDYEEAKTFLEKALKSDEENFGKEHPRTAMRYSNLATVLEYLGDYEEVLKLSKKALNIFKDKLPSGHPNIKIAEEIYEYIKMKIQRRRI